MHRGFYILMTIALTSLIIGLLVTLRSPVPSVYISKMEYVIDQSKGGDLSLEHAIERFASSQSIELKPGPFSLGLVAHPVWIKMALINPFSPIQQRLVAAQTWVDHVDVYFMTDNTIRQHWHSGDHEKADSHLLPDVGYVFNLDLPQGTSNVYIRVQSFDPLTLPLQLVDNKTIHQDDFIDHMITGIVFGMVVTLIAYNLIFYITLKQQHLLLYSLYMGCFLSMNIGYSGYGFLWLYPNNVEMQAYSATISMVLHGLVGLYFIRTFANIKENAPKLDKIIQIYAGVSLAALFILSAIQAHYYLSLFAFMTLAVNLVFMGLVGLVNRNSGIETYAVFIAIYASMIGLFMTALSVCGIIAYTSQAYHCAQYGFVLESLIVSFILARKLSSIEHERTSANQLASYDALTQLYNRRAFVHIGELKIQQAMSRDESISMIMLDIDHFKWINDQYGHHAGDDVLVEVGQVLRTHVEKDTIVARWGGEEMIILMPSTPFENAMQQAEILRKLLASHSVASGADNIRFTASFGVVERETETSLDLLYQHADQALYRAKLQGRNCVMPYSCDDNVFEMVQHVKSSDDRFH